MKVNKVVIDGEVKLDLSTDTVSEFDVIDGVSFHKANGELAEGSFIPQALSIYTAVSRDIVPPPGAYISKADIEIADSKYRLAEYFSTGGFDTITEEDFGYNVTVLKTGAFKNIKINKLYLPKTLIQIEPFPFEGCSISQIHYPGTIAELKQLFANGNDGDFSSWLTPISHVYDYSGVYVCSDGSQTYSYYEPVE